MKPNESLICLCGQHISWCEDRNDPTSFFLSLFQKLPFFAGQKETMFTLHRAESGSPVLPVLAEKGWRLLLKRRQHNLLLRVCYAITESMVPSALFREGFCFWNEFQMLLLFFGFLQALDRAINTLSKLCLWGNYRSAKPGDIACCHSAQARLVVQQISRYISYLF